MSHTFSIEEAAGSARRADDVHRKVSLRLLPFLLVCYIMLYLDRINISFAQGPMQADLGLSATAYGLGITIFFAGYLPFEIPSNMLMRRFGARKTMARIMILWGAMSAATMLVRTAGEFYVVRFLLGMFEAGFYPGLVLYLTYWFPPRRRARVLSLLVAATALAGLIGGPLSGWIITGLHAFKGLAGWQWMFLLQGIPTVLCGIATLWLLPDGPRSAAWLDREEKEIVVAGLGEDPQTRGEHRTPIRELVKGDVLALCFAWFTLMCGAYVLSFWVPAIIRSFGVSGALALGLWTAVPYGIGVVGMIAIGYHSDYRMERRWHFAACSLVGAVALALIPSLSGNVTLATLVLGVAVATVFGGSPIFWALGSGIFSRSAAPVGLALVNSVGLTAGLLAPLFVGWLKDRTGSFESGLHVVAVLLVCGGLLIPAAIRRGDILNVKK